MLRRVHLSRSLYCVSLPLSSLSYAGTTNHYEFGHARDFRQWCIKNHHDYDTMKRFVGSRHDISFENPFLCRSMVKQYCMFLRECITSMTGNMLQYVPRAYTPRVTL